MSSQGLTRVPSKTYASANHRRRAYYLRGSLNSSLQSLSLWSSKMYGALAALASLASLVPLVASHGNVVSPQSRVPGSNMESLCGFVVYGQIASDLNTNQQLLEQASRLLCTYLLSV